MVALASSLLVVLSLPVFLASGSSHSNLRVSKGGGKESSSNVWPGSSAVDSVDPPLYFPENLSGLYYYSDPQGSASSTTTPSLYAIQNSPSMLYRLKFNGRQKWLRDETDGWAAGKTLYYPSGTGSPDVEDVTMAELPSSSTSGTGSSSSKNLYACSERDGVGVSRLSVLLFTDDDATAPNDYLVASKEWRFDSVFPNLPDSNLGFEGITWIPDEFLLARSFVDASTKKPYDPARYPDHGTGLFFLALELDGTVHAFALDHSETGSGAVSRIAWFPSGSSSAMSLYFDRGSGYLWSLCDDSCVENPNEHNVHELIDGVFTSKTSPHYDPPKGIVGLNVEGFAISGDDECDSKGEKPVFWVDDGREVKGHALYQGTVKCGTFI